MLMHSNAKALFQRLPKIDFDTLPPAEQGGARDIKWQCSNMIDYAEDFEAAVSLIEAVQDIPMSPASIGQRSRWAMIAARDGAMTIYHIGFLHEKLRASFKACPALIAHSNHQEIKAAGIAFRAAFPLFEELRHSVGHSAELTATQEAREKNSLKQDHFTAAIVLGAGISARNTLSKRTFTQTIKGKAVGYELTSNTLNIILAILDRTFSAIRSSAPEQSGQP